MSNYGLQKKFSQLATAIFLLIALSSFSALNARNSVPRNLVENAAIPEMDRVRIWGDIVPDQILKLLEERRHQISRAHRAIDKSQAFLILSGGGEDGAFGAGLLTGWSAQGNRPKFSIVTGVSTGALIAPFAFLGSQYDRQLHEIYTQYGTNDLFAPQLLPALITGASGDDNTPFADIIARYVDRPLINAVAREHKKGRRLLVLTTNLDAQRPVIWDMGRIASSRHPNSLKLFRKVLQASASFPGLFPPVKIQVRAGGKHYEEMHIDGGASHNLFFAPIEVLQALSGASGSSRNHLYVLFHSKLTPEWKSVKQDAREIALRSISTLIKSHANTDIINLHQDAIKIGIRFHLASIPSKFNIEKTEPFDKVYMQKLFALGQKLGRKGFPRTEAP